jgi:hypothetical protein
MLENYG